jgi:type I restriction enzyme S subunit
MSDDLDFEMEVVKNGNVSTGSAADHEEEEDVENESSGQDGDASSADDRRSSGSEEPHKANPGESLAAALRQPAESSISGWEVVKLGDVLELEYGDNLPERDREDGSVPVYGSNGKVGTHSEPAVSAPGLVLGRKGSIGEIVLSESPFWPIDTTYYITHEETSLNLPYLQNLLQGLQLESLNAASAIPGLNRNDVYNLRVIVPPLSEQRKIASVLYAVDQAIQKTEAIIEQAKRVKRGLVQDLFQEGPNPEKSDSEETRFGPVLTRSPTHWDRAKIGDLYSEYQLGTAERGSTEDRRQIPLIKMGNLDFGTWDFSEVEMIDYDKNILKTYRLQKGDLLFNTRNTPDLVGKTAVWDFQKDAIYDNNLLRLRFDDRIGSGHYVNYYLSSGIGRRQLRARVHGTTSVAAIYQSDLEQVKIPLPPLDEQRQIVQKLRGVDRLVERNSVVYDELKRLKKGLMQDLLTGEVRTADKAIEVLDEVSAHG